MKIFFLIEIFILHLKNRLRSFAGFAPIPYKWLLQLTNDCNSKCVSCDIWKINKVNTELKKHESNLSDYEKLFKQSGAGLRWLALSGGEISLYDDFDNFLLLVKKYCPKLKLLTFTTNGIMTERILSIAMQIKNQGINSFVVISMDGDEKIHDASRGITGNYKLATALFNELKAGGVNVLYGATLNSLNVQYWVENLSEDVKSISLIHTDGIYNKKIATDDESLFNGLKAIMKRYKIKTLSELGEFVYLRLAIVFLKDKRLKTPIPCNVLSSSIHVYPNGDVHPCMYLPKIGNIKKESLEEMISGKEAYKQRDNIKNGNCAKCWMNCYAPHSISESPFRSIAGVIKSYL
jgi:MoaA/NifB/PqqE/SkfB family radical SAM enzyme